MLTEENFRDELHQRVGARLAEVHAPADLVDAVRARQARRTVILRGATAASAVAAVAVAVAVVVSVGVWWPHGHPVAPTAPLPSAVASSARLSVTPTPASSAEPSVAAVAPLVTSGPCAGLNVAAYLRPPGPRHPVIAVRAEGTVLSLTGTDTDASLAAKGPCADRLWYVPRTTAIQGANGMDQGSPFAGASGWIKGRPTAANQTAVVQLFLDCKGLVCSLSGAPLATITVHVEGNSAGAASAPYPAAPSPIPLPTGEVVVVPSVVGMTVDAAQRLLLEDGFQVGCSCFGGVTDNRIVTGQDLPPGTLAHLGGVGISITAQGPAPRPSFLTSATATGTQQPPASHSAGPSLPPAPALMPSVVGLSVDKALALLKSADVTYQLTYRYTSAAKGVVTFQSPKPGTSILPSTVVQLTVSLGPIPRS